MVIIDCPKINALTMKSEQQIIDAIANACEDEQLRFQIIIQDTTLHVYINRPTQASLDYHTLKQKIYTAIADLYEAKFKQICLYCRVLGELEPDWQSILELEFSNLASEQIMSMVEEIGTAVDATNSIVAKIEQELELEESFLEDPQLDFEDLPTTGEDYISEIKEAELSELLEDSVSELDLSKYCFISNQRLLYAVLDPPWSNIASLVDTFDRFDLATKRSQLPILEAYWSNSLAPNLDDFDPQVQAWWLSVQELDLDNRRKLAIWLSRYCLNAKETIATIREVVDAQSVAALEENLRSQSVNDDINELEDNQPELPSWLTNLRGLIGNFLKVFQPNKK